MKINTEMILDLEPCSDRKENYLEFYKDFEGSLEDFFKLEKISFHDKIWVSLRLVDKNTNIKFAVKCAEFVLPIFEKVFKNDKRIRDCIDFLKSIDDFENLNDDQLELLQFHDDAVNSASFSAVNAVFASVNVVSATASASAAIAATVAATTSASAVIAATSSATSAANSNNNTLQIYSTIFQFLLDLTN